MKTYMKATDGKITVFRASTGRAYVSAYFDGHGTTSGIAFSSKAGGHPVIEIDKAEYQALVELKKARTADNSPQSSWVDNSVLGKVAP